MNKGRTLLSTMILGMVVGLAMMEVSGMAQAKDPNERGRKLYVQYCASCHGMDARGSGPVAPTLKVAPTDLTMLAKRHGHWDALAVENSISGEKSVPAHGTKDMPVWGVYFRRQRDASVSTLNIYALMKYLEAVQIKETMGTK